MTGYQANVYRFHSTVDLSNEDNCCQSQGIGKLIKKKLLKGIAFWSSYFFQNHASKLCGLYTGLYSTFYEHCSLQRITVDKKIRSERQSDIVIISPYQIMGHDPSVISMKKITYSWRTQVKVGTVQGTQFSVPKNSSECKSFLKKKTNRTGFVIDVSVPLAN